MLNATRAFKFASLALAAFLALASFAFAQSLEFRRGLSAFNRAEYSTAFNEWIAEANAGGADAQSSLGFLYYKGLGVRQDFAVAFEWYARAAAQGQPEAQLFLGALYLYGDGVPKDLVKAYGWCEISQANGATGGLGCRDLAARHMSQSQIAAANQFVTDWYARSASSDKH